MDPVVNYILKRGVRDNHGNCAAVSVPADAFSGLGDGP